MRYFDFLRCLAIAITILFSTFCQAVPGAVAPGKEEEIEEPRTARAAALASRDVVKLISSYLTRYERVEPRVIRSRADTYQKRGNPYIEAAERNERRALAFVHNYYFNDGEDKDPAATWSSDSQTYSRVTLRSFLGCYFREWKDKYTAGGAVADASASAAIVSVPPEIRSLGRLRFVPGAEDLLPSLYDAWNKGAAPKTFYQFFSYLASERDLRDYSKTFYAYFLGYASSQWERKKRLRRFQARLTQH